MRLFLCAAILAALFPASVNAAGLARGKNFSIITPADPTQEAGDKYAKLVLNRAEEFRTQFIDEWLGNDAALGDVRTVISVSFSATENSGLTLARDNPSQKFHNVLLTATAENASGTMLRHEIVHTVLATAYPHRLPPWVEEGIASRYDREQLIAIRQREVRSWARTGQFPLLARLFVATDIASIDDTSYAVAESLVTYLLAQGSKRALIQCAAEAQRNGWDSALRATYGINGVAELQRDWQDWIGNSVQ